MASSQDDEASVSQDFVSLNINNPASPSDAFGEPPPPMISSEGIIAIDITEKFVSAASTLAPGELIKDGYFTLFESVGALEIMDPKMDSGCLAPGESLDEDYDVTRPLLPSEVLGIIDQLLSLEMAWHLGYPLSQTLFTSVYIDRILVADPATVEEADFIRNRAPGAEAILGILRAYCLGLLKSCWYVNERIKFEHYYEEEDFVTNTYHRSLLENIDRDEIRTEIMSARKTLHMFRSEISDEMAQALGFRLELRTAFLRAIELTELRSNPESLSLPWSQLQSVWEAIYKSRHLGRPVPEAFSTKIQRRLASTMPPRPIVQPSPEETYEHFKKLFADGVNVLNVLNYHDSQSLLNFVLAFQAQKPQPLVYIRTLLQNFLFQDMVILGQISIRQLVDDDLSLVVLPGSILLDPANDAIEAPNHPRFTMSLQMELFRQRAAQSFLDIFRAFCQNRCRVRRTLFHSIQDWEMVQLNAEEIDQILQTATEETPLMYKGIPSYSLPLSSWAYFYKLRLMEWIVQLGFELEIYQPDELAGMYRYLSYLAKNRAQHTERIQFFALHRLESTTSTSTSSGTTAGSPQDPRFSRSKSYLQTMALEAEMTWKLANALSLFYAALQRLGLIPRLTRPYSNDLLRYEVRMKPFAGIGLPELLSFGTFERATLRPGTSAPDLLGDASEAALGARAALEILVRVTPEEACTVGSHDRWVEDKKKVLRAAIAVGVAVETVRRAVIAHEQGEPGLGLGLEVEVPKPEKGYHDWWIVPRVVEVEMNQTK